MSAVLGVALLVLVGSAAAAGAHPLGNATVNRYARVEVSAGVVRVYYVLDYAELPAFQEGRAVRAGEARYLRSSVEQIRRGLDLSVGGRELALRPVQTGLDQPPGEADLLTLRVAAVFEARLAPTGPGVASTVRFADRNEPDRLGWREIVVVARGDAELRSSSAPDRDLSDELRSYPGDLIQAPLDLRSAEATFTPGRTPVPADALPRAGSPPNRSGDSLTELITRQRLGPGVLLGMLGVALAIGAGHAFLPGHGKTLMGAYLVGTKGRPIDALLLGVIVSLMHTGSVLVLGLVLYNVNRTISLDRLYPSLTVLSGCLAAAFGVFLLATRIRRMRRARVAHLAEGHDHLHHHDDHEDHGDPTTTTRPCSSAPAPAPVAATPGGTGTGTGTATGPPSRRCDGEGAPGSGTATAPGTGTPTSCRRTSRRSRGAASCSSRPRAVWCRRRRPSSSWCRPSRSGGSRSGSRSSPPSRSAWPRP